MMQYRGFMSMGEETPPNNFDLVLVTLHVTLTLESGFDGLVAVQRGATRMNGPQQTVVSCKELWQTWKQKEFLIISIN